MAEQEEIPSVTATEDIGEGADLDASAEARERERWKKVATDRRAKLLILNAPDNEEFHAIVGRARNGSKPLDIYEIAEFGLLGLRTAYPGELRRLVSRYNAIKRRGQMSIRRTALPQLEELCARTGIPTRAALIACTAYGASEVVRRRSAKSFSYIEERLRTAWSDPNAVKGMAKRQVDPASVEARLAELGRLQAGMKDGSTLPELTALMNDLGLNSLDVLLAADQASANANDRDLLKSLKKSSA
jgi:hypothetical protein